MRESNPCRFGGYCVVIKVPTAPNFGRAWVAQSDYCCRRLRSPSHRLAQPLTQAHIR